MSQRFTKRIFSAGALLRDLGFLLSRAPQLFAAWGNRGISRVFVEKIMTVTTAVNGCRYCSWFHARQAAASGISAEEVRNLMNLQFHADASEFELPGLLYAQAFAETNRRPDPDMTRRLFAFYGEKTASQIVLFIRMISFGNLLGNTWDAVISRFRGSPAEGSDVVFEMIFFLLAAPVMVPAMRLTRDERGSA